MVHHYLTVALDQQVKEMLPGKVRLVELSKPSSSLPAILTGIGSSLIGIDRAAKQVLSDVSEIFGVRARMDGIIFKGLGAATYVEWILTFIKDYLSALEILIDFLNYSYDAIIYELYMKQITW